ncbi:MAG: NERD domain-containing protein [Promethearchaeota archaeon]
MLKNYEREIREVWVELTDIDFFNDLDGVSEITNFLFNFNFIKIKNGNYSKNKYVVIKKIPFICECMRFVDFDLKDLSELLDFRGFESLIQEILSRYGYHTTKNFRFSDKSSLKTKRYEIDIIAIKQRQVLVIDAKQWTKKDSYGAMNEAANLQYKRAEALKNNYVIFSDLLQDLTGYHPKIKNTSPYILIPLMVTLEENYIQLNEHKIPLVSIYRLNSFLEGLYLNLDYYKQVHINRISVQKRLF